MASSIINFYDPAVNAPFDSSKPSTTTLESFMNEWTDDELESHHDYIQQLFPLPERSPINPAAPIITKELRDAFHAREDLRTNLRQAFGRMCKFYGYALTPGTDHEEIRVAIGLDFTRRAQDSWLTTSDHNHLRISRIIRCLRILGLEKEAHAFFKALIMVDEGGGGVVSQRSKTFWQKADEWPLSIPPSYPREPEVEWLKET